LANKNVGYFLLFGCVIGGVFVLKHICYSKY
jgi:hypothetical protein